jgi:hypothetical protein
MQSLPTNHNPMHPAPATPRSVSMASLGAISSLANLLKSYQMRTGKPAEVEFNAPRNRQ